MSNVDDQRPDGVTVYNLEVAEGHTYFVADGSGQVDAFIWVHNAYLHANSARSRRPNHGYVIFDEKSGEILKFGISSGKIRADGLSYRALRQISRLSTKHSSMKLSTITLEKFKNRARALEWEEQMVAIFRGKFGRSLPEQIRP